MAKAFSLVDWYGEHMLFRTTFVPLPETFLRILLSKRPSFVMYIFSTCIHIAFYLFFQMEILRPHLVTSELFFDVLHQTYTNGFIMYSIALMMVYATKYASQRHIMWIRFRRQPDYLKALEFFSRKEYKSKFVLMTEIPKTLSIFI